MDSYVALPALVNPTLNLNQILGFFGPGLGLGSGLGLGLAVGLGEGVGLEVGLGLAVGLGLGDGLGDGVGDGLGIGSCSGSGVSVGTGTVAGLEITGAGIVVRELETLFFLVVRLGAPFSGDGPTSAGLLTGMPAAPAGSSTRLRRLATLRIVVNEH